MPKLIFLCFALSFVSGLITEEAVKFIEQYFTYKYIHVVICFTCSKHDTLYVTKSLMKTGKFWMVSPDPDQPLEYSIDSIIKRDYHKIGIFLDYDCPRSKKHLFEISERKLMNSTFNWLIWSKIKFNSDIEYLKLHMDTEMTWACPDGSANQVVMYDLYKITYVWPINATVAGHWDIQHGIVYNLTEYKYSRRQDMRGVQLRTGIVVNNIPTDNLEEELLKPENRVLDSMATYNYKIFLMMQQFYNFTKKIIYMHEFGYVVEDGRFEGMVKMLKEKEVDISISAMLLNRPRMDNCDFCPVMTWALRICALFRHPPVTGKYSVLLKPFEPSLWLGCAVMWFLMMVALRFISFFESQYHVEQDGEISPEIEGAWTWSDTLVIIMGALSQQGSTMDSKWITGRIVFLNTHILALMMNAYYSAFVVSSLLSAPTHNIRTTRDLIDSSLEFGAEDINYNRPYFEMNTDPLVHELYTKKMAPPHVGYYSREDGLHKVLHDKFAYHTEAINVYKTIEDTFTDQAKCDLTEIIVFPIEPCYPFIPKSSPLKELFTYSYRRAVESGLIKYMNQHWRPEKPPCSLKTEFRSVGVATIQFGVWLLTGGAILAVFMYIVEVIVIHRLCWKRKNIKPTKPKTLAFPQK